MTLGEFATAVGATPRWVLNTLTQLHVPRRYQEPLARRLALARLINETAGTPMKQAFALAARALAEADPHGSWRHESGSGAVALAVDMPRFFTSYGARLALARNHYGEKQRGRRTSKRRSAVARAKEYGVDVTLLDSALSRPRSKRLEMLADNMEFLRALRERTP